MMEICSKCNMPVGEWNEQRRRERFQAAAMAMQGMLAGGWNVMELGVAAHAITMADALLAELDRGES
jgi:hypothetical protein